MASKRRKRSEKSGPKWESSPVNGQPGQHWEESDVWAMGAPCDPAQLPLRYAEMCWHVAALLEATRHERPHRERMVILLGAVWELDGGNCHRAIGLADVCRVR